MIFVPFTYIHGPTWEALDGQTVMPWKVDKGDGYLEYFRYRWKEGRDFVNVEHDVVVQPGQLEQFRTCHNEWCVFPELHGSPSLSLVRFRASFIRANPGIWSRGWQHPAGQGATWTWLDSHLVNHAETRPCLHLEPPCVNTRPLGSLHDHLDRAPLT